MRHRKSGKKFGKKSKHRTAMFSNMVQALIREERIVTTVVKAKELRAVADQMVSLAKDGGLAARRMAARTVKTPEVLQKLFNDYPARFEGRNGGYTRVIHLGQRRGDCAEMAVIEFLSETKAAAPAEAETEAKE